MRIESFDARTDTDSLRAWYRIQLAASACDTPWHPQLSFNALQNRWQSLSSDDPRQAWLARDDAGEAVGCYVLRLPEKHNPTVAFCELTVTPERRRAGTGSRLLAHCADRAREAGRFPAAWSRAGRLRGREVRAAAGSLNDVAEVLASDLLDGKWAMLWNDEQRGIGELMTKRPSGASSIVRGHAAFHRNYHKTFAPWMERFAGGLPLSRATA